MAPAKHLPTQHSTLSARLVVGDGDLVDLDGGVRVVILVAGGVVDLHHNVHATGHATEHGVLGRGALVEEVQEGVVHHVQEELRSAGVGRASVGHGHSARLVGELGAAGLSELVRDASLGVAADLALAGHVVLGVGVGPTSTGSSALGVTRVRAAELVHEVLDHSVEV